jgi:plastocyanin
MNVMSVPGAPRILAAITVVTIAVSGFALWRGFATGTASARGSATAADTNGATPVDVADFAFAPDPITVTAGTPIAWTNEDQVDHSIRSANGAFTEQPLAAGGGTAVVTLTEAGTYAYICGIHPAMTGTIEVTP